MSLFVKPLLEFAGSGFADYYIIIAASLDPNMKFRAEKE
jgi:hypothetical protein